jgi:hypothetical protein
MQSLICLKRERRNHSAFSTWLICAVGARGEKIPPQQSERVFMWLRATSDDGFDNFIL